MTQYGFFFDQSRCYGCQACAAACKDWNGIDPGPEKWMTVYEWETGTFPTMRIHALAFACGHCENPTCIPACPNNAIFKEDEYGAVLVDDAICEGCHTCYEACAFGAPKFASDEKGSKMSKCTMCIDRLEAGDKPLCVLSCPMRALDFGPLDELKEKYGDLSQLDGMPDTSIAKPSYVFKPLAPRKNLVPFDVDKYLELSGAREGGEPLYEDFAEVLDIPDQIMTRNGLTMRHATVEDLMAATRNDLG